MNMIAEDRLVWKPKVIKVAENRLDYDGLIEAFDHQGLNHLHNVFNGEPFNHDNPVNRLFEAIENGEDNGDHLIEFAGRHCYRSWAKGRQTDEYVRNVIEMQHGSVLEHGTISVVIYGVSRALTHELIRHRHGQSPSQESQRFVDAKNIHFVVPPAIEHLSQYDASVIEDFRKASADAVERYMVIQDKLFTAFKKAEAEGNVKEATMIKKRVNEAARAVMPNSAETRGTFTYNMRTIRHILNLRGASNADLEIMRMAKPLYDVAVAYAPSAFWDVTWSKNEYGVETATLQYPHV